MDRGVYFDGWMKHNHCYHPSLPLRNLQMLEDLEKYHGNVLVWAGMGGGSISLPYLENEAFGSVDPRMQFYGYMNDSDFAKECGKRGIKLFGIVFEVQGWEFPAVVDAETGKITRINLHAQLDENHTWYGLREFSQNKYPDAFRTSLKDYYPNGIYNSEGQKVDDLWEECCARTLHGEPVHAKWVEVKKHDQQCYQMCRNNPVWREYLKKIMMVQIDAGVQGIQLDECELPMTAIGSGGCFCKDCMHQFTQYLKKRREEGRLSREWDSINLDTFNYKEYLLANGHDFPKDAPFFREYWEFQVYQVRRYFGELVDFAKDYAQKQYGRELPVSGNFFNLQPAYYPIESKVDILITEMEHTLFRQPHFYRYCAGFANGKTIIVAENPYGGIVPKLVEMLDQGKGYDLYRIFLLEASAYGCNMAVPYGGWMGNTIKDSFHPPRKLTAQVQDFLYQHEDFFPKGPVRGVCVLYSFGSYYWREATKGGGGGNGMQDNFENLMEATTVEWDDPTIQHLPFWDVAKELSSRGAMYDVKMVPDGDFRPDDFKAEDIAVYPMLVVPDCNELTVNQANILEAYAKNNGKVLVYGRLAENTDLANRLAGLPNVRFVSLHDNLQESMERFLSAFDAMYADVCTVRCSDSRLGMQRFDWNGKTYVHLLNYGYDATKDRIEPVHQVTLRLRDVAGPIRVFTLDGETDRFSVTVENDETVVTLETLQVYAAVTAGVTEKTLEQEK